MFGVLWEAIKLILGFSWSPGLELQIVPDLVLHFQGVEYELQLQGAVSRMAIQNLCEKLTHSADYCVFQDRLVMSPGHLLSREKEKSVSSKSIHIIRIQFPMERNLSMDLDGNFS